MTRKARYDRWALAGVLWPSVRALNISSKLTADAGVAAVAVARLRQFSALEAAGIARKTIPCVSPRRIGGTGLGFYCRRPRICPWCYARQVLLSTMWSLDFLRRLRPAPEAWVLLGIRRVFPAVPAPAEIGSAVRTWLASGRPAAARLVAGSRTVVSVLPSDTAGALAVGRHSLYLVAADPMPAISRTAVAGGRVQSKVFDFSTDGIGRAARWTFAFPGAALTANPGVAALLLSRLAAGRVPLLKTCGLLDNIAFRRFASYELGEDESSGQDEQDTKTSQTLGDRGVEQPPAAARGDGGEVPGDPAAHHPGPADSQAGEPGGTPDIWDV